MKVWITKYALTTGIFAREAEEVGDRMICIRPEFGSGELTQYHHKLDWHIDPLAAANRAREMQAAKLKSLDKQRAKIAALIF